MGDEEGLADRASDYEDGKEYVIVEYGAKGDSEEDEEETPFREPSKKRFRHGGP